MAPWRTSIDAEEPEPPQETHYQAVLSLHLEESTIIFNREVAEVERERLISAVLKPPNWSLRPWSFEEPPPGQDVPEDVLLRGALEKLKALLDFAADLPDGTADEIEAAVAEEFPRERGVEMQPGTHYKRFEVEAKILINGRSTWGYLSPGGGEWPPGVSGPVHAKHSQI